MTRLSAVILVVSLAVGQVSTVQTNTSYHSSMKTPHKDNSSSPIVHSPPQQHRSLLFGFFERTDKKKAWQVRYGQRIVKGDITYDDCIKLTTYSILEERAILEEECDFKSYISASTAEKFRFNYRLSQEAERIPPFSDNEIVANFSNGLDMENNGRLLFQALVVALTSSIAVLFHQYYDNIISLNSTTSLNQTTITHISPQQLFHFPPDNSIDNSCSLLPNNRRRELITSKKISSVVPLMKKDAKVPDDQVFMMLNGENEGVYMYLNESSSCNATLSFLQAAHTAATVLGADLDWLDNGMHFKSQYGDSIQDLSQIYHHRIVHILLDRQIFVWPGIHVGFIYNNIKMNNDDDVVVSLETLSITPKVLVVRNFFTPTDVYEIKSRGLNSGIAASPVVFGSKEDQNSSPKAVRTSSTAFLNDSDFTRSMRSRSASVARLPSPSFAGNLQLVTYDGPSQFFKPHMDIYESKDLMTFTESFTWNDFTKWVEWIQKQLRLVDLSTPTPSVSSEFQLLILSEFCNTADDTNYFAAHKMKAAGQWIVSQIQDKRPNLLQEVLQTFGNSAFLQDVIRNWQLRHYAQYPNLIYRWPNRKVSAVSHYFAWIRYVQERQETRDFDCVLCNPAFTQEFQVALVQVLLSQSSSSVSQIVSSKHLQWMRHTVKQTSKAATKDMLIKLLRLYDLDLIKLVITSWEEALSAKPSIQYEFPRFVPHIAPQRFVTLFLYLNTVKGGGGATKFPLATGKKATMKKTPGCEEEESTDGALIVPATELQAALFYSLKGDQTVDFSALHEGCAPITEGEIKYGSNQFMWNVRTEEGFSAWK